MTSVIEEMRSLCVTVCACVCVCVRGCLCVCEGERVGVIKSIKKNLSLNDFQSCSRPVYLLFSHQCHSFLLEDFTKSIPKVSHDSLFIPTFITKPIIFAMVA